MKIGALIATLIFTTASLLMGQGTELPVADGAAAGTIEKGKGMIIGRVVDQDTDTPLDFATISVLTRKDSSVVTGGISEVDGKFAVEVAYGEYLVKVEFISYNATFIDNVVLAPGKKLADLGTIALSVSAQVLQEIEVVAEKSEMTFDLDKRVFNVGKDLANKGGSAEEILDNIPSVTVDVDGNVSLRGSENVRILVDGKPSGLIGVGDTDGLKSLPAGMIDRVEVVTNASARYEASGTSGIINIVLKKDRQKGINGSLDVNAGFPKRYGAAVNLNARRDKVNWFLNYGLRNRTGPGSGYTNQEFYSETIEFPYTEQLRTSERGGVSNSFRGGFDLFLSDRDILTAAALYRIGDDYSDALTTFRDFDRNRVLREISERVQDETEEEIDAEYELNYERKFDREGQKFTAQFQYQNSEETESSDYLQTSFDAEYIPLDSDILTQKSINVESNGTYLLQADYVQPLNNDQKIELGTRNSIRRIGNDYLVEELNNGIWERLDNLSNNFNYEENIYAVYAIYANKVDKWSYQIGVRGEHSEVLTELLETQEVNDRSYTNLFPSGHLNYEINKGNALQLSYSRRISRPRFWYLNPFFTFSNNRNIWGGNPNLDPEFTDSYEMGYLRYWDKATLGSSLYYRHTTGVIERIARIEEDGITRTQPENLSTQNSYGLEFTGSIDFTKWWRLDGSLNIFSQKTQGQIDDIILEAEAFSFQNRLSSRIKFWKDAEFQTRLWYRAPENRTQGRRKSMYSLDLGFSKDLLKKKATITISVQDLLNTRKYRNETFGNGFYSDSEFQRRAGQTTVSFNYRINQKKQRERGERGEGGDGGDFNGEF
ncbi:MAG: TonB-dependent receptor [Saprospiraceae bacterium]|nr:TonB-dependent receptor [Saprospiraceae bacterium]